MVSGIRSAGAMSALPTRVSNGPSNGLPLASAPPVSATLAPSEWPFPLTTRQDAAPSEGRREPAAPLSSQAGIERRPRREREGVAQEERAPLLEAPLPLSTAFAAVQPQRMDQAAPAAAPSPAPAPPTPSATLQALARQPGALPRQWQFEITAHAHAAPLTLNARRQAAEPGRAGPAWALQIGLPAAAATTTASAAQAQAMSPTALPVVSAAQMDRLAMRLARGGVTVGALHVGSDAVRSGLDDTFDERFDDDASPDRR